MKGRDDCNFSFSGLKTGVRQAQRKSSRSTQPMSADICAAFQLAACEAVADRVRCAMTVFQDLHADVQNRVLSRRAAWPPTWHAQVSRATCDQAGFALSVPPVALCTDNAAMIAWAGLENAARRDPDDFSLSARARWPLDADAEPQPFAGVKA